ncbi:MAG: acyl-ACP--UDP-N-acetylglucosamine O-acyltransferase [Candidatus Krumholzibacteria bacterium]|jgi:UDP-N-acetylglucosamine acyltransferase|nr:acyl-ACP--UDP-N-acetylglucosamine O-acyltransferase [Candidatus Krumholzibacteria bacterium]MDP6668860.1 acyl-ACP--UDP-N-acetylglucosamine O-acyltransferase [Candidatus Krumholzibacteria bacterium]MDP6796425.1 acyl-ACP--UDP-N-acetylglucosamine O-acyltransferase [Candidatus Krumholzibacteria bacterium]MDP7020814.1 acyl-ACP--UDP-N-acetylglucosamine O-acyltransferase [Candidatus Krumholzibacteria bacterium]
MSVMNREPGIHPTALVHKDASLGEGVRVGPYSIIEANAEIGAGSMIGSHVRIESCVRMGSANRVFQGAVLGSPPQDLKFRGEESFLTIGSGNTIREYVTMNPGTGEGEETRIGDENMFMAYVHVAHNCRIADQVIIANAVQLAGHVEVEEFAILGGMTPVHQFVKIGAHAFVGGGSRVAQDVPPYLRVAGSPPRVAGLNLVGLQRRNFPMDSLEELKKVYRVVYRQDLNLSQAMDKLDSEEIKDTHALRFLDFILKSERGITR